LRVPVESPGQLTQPGPHAKYELSASHEPPHACVPAGHTDEQPPFAQIGVPVPFDLHA
jgi:hypothetical protein